MSSFVREKLRRTKIKKLQLDPFGFCNAKCWFCPVKYIPQPQEGSGNMSVDLIEKIFQDLSEEKKKIILAKKRGFLQNSTASNEID